MNEKVREEGKMRERAVKVCRDLAAQYYRAYQSGQGENNRACYDALQEAAQAILQLPEKEG